MYKLEIKTDTSIWTICWQVFPLYQKIIYCIVGLSNISDRALCINLSE